jgi:hypothetical protein
MCTSSSSSSFASSAFAAATFASAAGAAFGQGFTLDLYSAQPEPFLGQNAP